MDLKYDVWLLTIETFYSFLKNDHKIFKRFKKNPSSLTKIKFQANLLTAKSKDDQFSKATVFGDEYLLTLKLSAMILRYHGLFISVDTLTNNSKIQQDIERSERNIFYEEMEEISKGLDIHILNFDEYREVTSNGFKEIIQLNDRTKAEAKAISKRESGILEDKMFLVLNEQSARIEEMNRKALEQIKFVGNNQGISGDLAHKQLADKKHEQKLLEIDTKIQNLELKIDT